MAKLSPHEVYLAAVAGGAAIGLILAGLGGIMLSAAFGNVMQPLPDAVAGAAFFVVGAAFVLVSLIVLPAIRAIQLEPEALPR
jgi:hypothetical protein